ncbi:hypothetical protein F4780DRAFT_784666 [Xylariomycetidae sp. FL0641]|nr:hypothetical protein F4780DRAFT_784666 [Xylariomycetidae sp. FL0641]
MSSIRLNPTSPLAQARRSYVIEAATKAFSLKHEEVLKKLDSCTTHVFKHFANIGMGEMLTENYVGWYVESTFWLECFRKRIPEYPSEEQKCYLEFAFAHQKPVRLEPTEPRCQEWVNFFCLAKRTEKDNAKTAISSSGGKKPDQPEAVPTEFTPEYIAKLDPTARDHILALMLQGKLVVPNREKEPPAVQSPVETPTHDLATGKSNQDKSKTPLSLTASVPGKGKDKTKLAPATPADPTKSWADSEEDDGLSDHFVAETTRKLIPETKPEGTKQMAAPTGKLFSKPTASSHTLRVVGPDGTVYQVPPRNAGE